MRLTRAQITEGGKTESADFSRKRTMNESIRRLAVVSALMFSVSCGGGGPTDSGSGGSDSGTVSDGGDGGHADGGSDAGTSLCAMYGDGHPNRATFHLGDGRKIQDSSTQSTMVFKGITLHADGNEAMMGTFAPPETYPLGYQGFKVGVQRGIYFFGAGLTTVEPCSMTASACDITIPVGTKSGDVNCTVTIAADRPWAP